MLDNLKFGSLVGAEAFVLIIITVLAVVAIVAVVVLAVLKAIMERKDVEEDKAENEFYAEYGITGEELRLYQRIARLRNGLPDDMPVAQKNQENPIAESEPDVQDAVDTLPQEHVVAPIVEAPVKEEVKEKPVQDAVQEPIKEEPKAEPVQEPVKEEPAPAPIQEPVKEETVLQPVQEPIKAQESVKEEPAPSLEESKKPSATPKKVVKEKIADWSNYDGPYEGYYYDPEDACYYEGAPSFEYAEEIAQRDAEYDMPNASEGRIVPLKTPKNVRKEVAKFEGFDESVIYGKYVIEHVDTRKGTQEWFYTLYDAKGKNIYESSNYSTKEYCERAINRFKSHVASGSFTIQASGGKFFFVLKRKSYVHRGMSVATSEEASKNRSAVKKFAQTSIIREQ